MNSEGVIGFGGRMTEYRGQIKEFSAAAGQNSEKANNQ